VTAAWSDLHRLLRGAVREGEPLAPHTTIRIGGPAAAFAEPQDLDDLRRALAWAAEAGRPWRVVGLGSNLLCPDEGFPGLVLALGRACGGWRFEGTRLRAGAGAHLVPLVHEACRRGLGGLEPLAGIPGTVGGAVAMNAGTPAGTMGDVVRRVLVLGPDGQLAWWDRDDLAFGYRRSRLLEEPWVAVEAELELVPRDPGTLAEALRTSAARRRRTQPLEWPNLGSVWRNPPGDYAGRLVEAAGCKGWRRGDAEVSERHGNFIVNRGRATAADVLGLMADVRAAVEGRLGVRLHPEVRWLLGQADLEARLAAAAARGPEG
jgi:UDP-N-acetylmuramate dehydrogenase